MEYFDLDKLIILERKIKFVYYKILNNIRSNKSYKNDLEYLKLLVKRENEEILKLDNEEEIRDYYLKDYSNEKDIMVYHRFLNKLLFRLMNLYKDNAYDYITLCIQNIMSYDFDKMLLHFLKKSNVKALDYIQFDIIYKNHLLEDDFINNKLNINNDFYFQSKLFADKLNATFIYDDLMDDYKESKYKSIYVYLNELSNYNNYKDPSVTVYLNTLTCSLMYLNEKQIKKIYITLELNKKKFDKKIYNRVLECFDNIELKKQKCLILSYKNN